MSPREVVEGVEALGVAAVTLREAVEGGAPAPYLRELAAEAEALAARVREGAAALWPAVQRERELIFAAAARGVLPSFAGAELDLATCRALGLARFVEAPGLIPLAGGALRYCPGEGYPGAEAEAGGADE